MVVVLFLLAVFLIASGGAALFSGYELLLGDRGLPIMISGATVLAAGLILAGLAVVARHLSRMAQQLGDMRVALADMRSANLLATARPPRPVELGRAEPEMPPPARAPRQPPEERTEEGAALVVPEDPEEPETQPAQPAPVRPAEALRAVEAVRRPEPPRPPAPEPQQVPVAEPEPEPDRAEPAEEPNVVGRYSSGGNNYTMYADGSIIADTPNGQHRFASLDELKAFVAGGGERR